MNLKTAQNNVIVVTVTSEREAGTKYQTSLNIANGVCHCTCPDHTHRRAPGALIAGTQPNVGNAYSCKHAQAVKSHFCG